MQNITHNQAVEAFKRFDKNNNGTMEARELREALFSLLSYDIVSSDTDLMSFADSNRDGVISFNEFCYLIEQLNGANSQQSLHGNASSNRFYSSTPITTYTYSYTTSYDSDAPGRFIGSHTLLEPSLKPLRHY